METMQTAYIKDVQVKPEDFFVTIKDVMTLTSISRCTINSLMDKGDFPRPYKITETRKAWKYSDIMKWINEREVIEK